MMKRAAQNTLVLAIRRTYNLPGHLKGSVILSAVRLVVTKYLITIGMAIRDITTLVSSGKGTMTTADVRSQDTRVSKSLADT